MDLRVCCIMKMFVDFRVISLMKRVLGSVFEGN